MAARRPSRSCRPVYPAEVHSHRVRADRLQGKSKLLTHSQSAEFGLSIAGEGAKVYETPLIGS